jgi:hypothetical protein
MTTGFMPERETVAPLHSAPFNGVQALIDHDSRFIEKNRPQDVGATAGTTRNAKQFMGVVELNAQPEVSLDDIFDGDRRRDCYASSVRVFGQ